MSDYPVFVTAPRSRVKVDESPRVASASWGSLVAYDAAGAHLTPTYPVPNTR